MLIAKKLYGKYSLFIQLSIPWFVSSVTVILLFFVLVFLSDIVMSPAGFFLVCFFFSFFFRLVMLCFFSQVVVILHLYFHTFRFASQNLFVATMIASFAVL